MLYRNFILFTEKICISMSYGDNILKIKWKWTSPWLLTFLPHFLKHRKRFMSKGGYIYIAFQMGEAVVFDLRLKKKKKFFSLVFSQLYSKLDFCCIFYLNGLPWWSLLIDFRIMQKMKIKLALVEFIFLKYIRYYILYFSTDHYFVLGFAHISNFV